jgi:hypothetical protein
MSGFCMAVMNFHVLLLIFQWPNKNCAEMIMYEGICFFREKYIFHKMRLFTVLF